MVKFLAAIVSMIVIMLTTALLPGSSTVNITSRIPEIVNPGDEFMVQVNIDKNILTGKAIFQQILPVGFTATAIQTEGATFTFENRVARFTWDNMPSGHVLVIAYKVLAGNETTGLHKITGSFNCIGNESADNIQLAPVAINVTNDIPVSNAEHVSTPSTSLKMERRITAAEPGYDVTLSITKGAESGFGILFEQIPAGYSAVATTSAGSEVQSEGNVLKFTWKNLPQQPVWSVTYSLIPASGSLPEPVPIAMMVCGNQDHIHTSVPIGDLSPLRESLPSEKPVAAGTNTPRGVVNIPAPQKGIYFRVQIAATRHSPVRDNYYFSHNFGITKPVDMVEHEGWRKYCVGTFSRYDPARNYAQQARNTIPDAFVVAYRNGQRIPMEEAHEVIQ